MLLKLGHCPQNFDFWVDFQASVLKDIQLEISGGKFRVHTPTRQIRICFH